MSWKMYALLNYGRIMAVCHRRKNAVEYAAELVDGGKITSDEMLRNGSFTIIKVEVRELPKREAAPRKRGRGGRGNEAAH